MMKIAEKLIILKEAGEGLLQRIASAKRILSSPTLRPAFLSDQQYSRVTQALLKKFPEFEQNVEKTPGYDTLTGKSKAFFDDLEPLYFAFVDAFEFKEAAVQTLCEIASSIVEMKVEDNPLVTVNFLDLFAIATQLNFLISFIEERKIVLAVYYKLFFFIKCTNEPNFARVAKYAVALDDPIKVMQDEFRPLNSSLGKTLINLLPLYTKLKTVTLLRKEGTLNLTLKPEEMSKPVVDKFHYQLVNSNNMYLWIIFGFLMCPETLALPGAIDLCKLALTDGFVVPIFRNSTIQLHVEYDNLFSNYKSKTVNLSKHKKLVKDVIPESVQKGALSHKQRRVYLRQELSALCNLFADKPGLLGPKIQIAIGALSLAKEEVFWYFRHFKAPAPKGYSKKITEDEMKDNRISEILFLMDKLTSLIKQNKRIVQQYYLEYLKGADKKKITEVCDSGFYSTVGTGISQIAKSIIDEVSNINVDAFIRGNKQYDFKGLRLNWFRAEAFFSSVQSSVPLIKIKPAVDRFTLIYNHTRFVDDLDALLDQHASLKQLWYFKDIFVESFSRSIKDGPNQPLHCLTYLNLLSEFTNNSTQYNPEERAEIGVQVVQQAEKFLDELAARTVALINEVAKQYILFDSGLADVNAAYPLLIKRKDYKLPKDFNPPVPPGMESNYRSRGHLDRLRLYERNCWQLCAALNEVETITVFDHVFAPREYLREKLIESFRSFVRSASSIEIYDDKHRLIEKQIQRPSVVEKQLETYVSSLKLLENYVDFDLGEMMREVIIGEIWIPALGKAGTLDFASAEETDIKFNGNMVGNFVTWYGDFISKKASSPQSGIIFSQARKGFVSKLGMPLRAELYTDIVELKSLCNLIGPYGVKLIDREILKFVLSSVNTLKDYVSHNRQALDELRMNYHNESACNESLKKIKEADNFISRSIGIGNALNFRELLHEALRYVMEEKTPFLFSSIHNSFNQYRRNTFMSPELLGIDLLALESGIEIGTADQAIKKFLSKAIGSADAPLWDLLPFMYAASFNSATWKDAQYNPVLEGHNNNAHSLAKCISSLIVAFKAITNSNADEKEIVVLLQKFVTASSVLLLRIARGSGNKQDKHTPVDIPSMIIFMDKFIQECPLLSREALESVLPYALLRNEWKNIFSTKVPSAQSKKELTAE